MTHIFEKNDFSFMELKDDHLFRPLWINPADASVILEGFSPIAEQVQDFLVAIGEPISRPTFMHEYKITAYSLYAAVSVGLETNDIISVLSHLSKTPVPESITQLIMDCTVSYGKIKLVLKRNKYHVEVTDPKVLQMLLEDPMVSSARVMSDGMGHITTELRGLLASGDVQNADILTASTAPSITANASHGMLAVNVNNRQVHTDFDFTAGKYLCDPALDENDEDDDQNSYAFEVSPAKLDDLKKRCLELDYPLLEEYDFRNDTVNPTLNIDLKPLTVIRPYQEKCLGKMFSNGRARSGIIVLPCGAGKTLVGITAASTLVREDDRIDDLNYMIGPKLYEANWMELAAKGHIATVQCAEVWCPMTPEFYYEYLKAKNREKVLLWCMNPNKFQACQFLINFHEKRGDKIIVFSDNVFTLKEYARKLGKPFICGEVGPAERVHVLQAFQHDPSINTIFLSKSLYNIGRILRAKRRNDQGFNAYFYSLVSKDTQEMYFSIKRQQFLIDQGYSFRVITHLDGMERMPGLVLQTKSEQIELLKKTLQATDEDRILGSDVARGEGDLAGTVTSNVTSRPLFEEES
ncbi:hypothetical protein FRC00_010375 [Tulasnella sp. 408]|nr:hypothetical protein FRC00_010375 [Tulasnella sp. 408]